MYTIVCECEELTHTPVYCGNLLWKEGGYSKSSIWVASIYHTCFFCICDIIQLEFVFYFKAALQITWHQRGQCNSMDSFWSEKPWTWHCSNSNVLVYNLFCCCAWTQSQLSEKAVSQKNKMNIAWFVWRRILGCNCSSQTTNTSA